jgi:hypothetical protein
MRRLYRLYIDKANGVSFSYPSDWVLNGDDDAATAKLRVALSSGATAVVTLEGNFADSGPYKGTEFEAGAFSYAVKHGGTATTCFAAVDALSEGDLRPVPIFWNEMPARRMVARSTVAGTDDVHQVIAAFGRGRCYQFEMVIVSHAAEDAEKPLGAARWRVLREAFAEVMGSVRVTSKP